MLKKSKIINILNTQNMTNQAVECGDSLDFELKFTTRVLTHKLSSWSFANSIKIPKSAFQELPAYGRRVPAFPLNQLNWILNLINNRENIINHKVETNWVDSNFELSSSQEDQSSPKSDEGNQISKERNSCPISLPIKPDPCDNFVKPADEVPDDVVSRPEVTEDTRSKTKQYEKKNIYYKAIFRDIRKYFIELLNSSTDYVNLKKKDKYKAYEPSIFQLISFILASENITASQPEVNEMAHILGPFLNYNEFLVSFKERKEEDPKCILDCLQNFTLTKMKRVLQFPVIKFVVSHYCKHTVVDGASGKIRSI